MTEWAIAFVCSTGLAAAGFVVVAVLWLKKLRETLAATLGETAGQQIRSSQRMGETIAAIQRRQQATEQQIYTLAQANARLQKELDTLAGKNDPGDTEPQHQALPSRVLH